MNANLKLPERFNPIFNSIEEFELTKELGSGAFAKVFQGTCKITQQQFAIKRIYLSRLCNSDKDNIENEIKIHSRINHKHVVRFVDFFVEKRIVNIVLELCPLGNLYKQMRTKPLSENQIKQVFYQSCVAVQFLHGSRVLLRDLKPENILVDSSLNVKLCDFGWAAMMSNSVYCRSRAGTFAYMSPESLKGALQGEKSDIWSLGVLLYELIHLQEPFDGNSCGEQLLKIQTQKLRFSRSINDDARNLITAVLKINEEERPTIETMFRSKYMQQYIASLNTKEVGKKNNGFKIGTSADRTPLHFPEMKSAEQKMFNLKIKIPEINEPKNLNLKLKVSPTVNSKFVSKFGMKVGKMTTENMPHSPGVFNNFLDSYTTSKSPTRRDLTRSMIEKVLSPSPNKSINEVSSKPNTSNLKIPIEQSKRNVFLNFSKSPQANKENVFFKNSQMDEQSRFNFKAMLLKKNFANRMETENPFQVSRINRAMTPSGNASSSVQIGLLPGLSTKLLPSSSSKIWGVNKDLREGTVNRKIVFAPSFLRDKSVESSTEKTKNSSDSEMRAGFFEKAVTPGKTARATLYTIASSKSVIREGLKTESDVGKDKKVFGERFGDAIRKEESGAMQKLMGFIDSKKFMKIKF